MASPPLASVCVARFPHTRFLRSPPGRRGEGAKFVGWKEGPRGKMPPNATAKATRPSHIILCSLQDLSSTTVLLHTTRLQRSFHRHRAPPI